MTKQWKPEHDEPVPYALTDAAHALLSAEPHPRWQPQPCTLVTAPTSDPLRDSDALDVLPDVIWLWVHGVPMDAFTDHERAEIAAWLDSPWLAE